MVVKYSALKHNTEDELRRIMSFLDVDVDNTTMQCVMNTREGQYHRTKKKKLAPSDVFDQTMTTHIDSIKRRVYEKFPVLESLTS